MDRFAASSGVDLRHVSEATIGRYRGSDGGCTVFVARHGGDASTIERLFRQRLVLDERRAVDRHDLIRVSGRVGTVQQTLVVLGREVVALQCDGDSARGPGRVAALYAEGKLKRAPRALAEGPLHALAVRLGAADLIPQAGHAKNGVRIVRSNGSPVLAAAFAPGPFEGELARGARGLLAAATGVGAVARKSAREKLALFVALTGDFNTVAEQASNELVAAWSDLSESSFGKLLGLDRPIERPLATHSAESVGMSVEINPVPLARGLASATSASIEEIMR